MRFGLHNKWLSAMVIVLIFKALLLLCCVRHAGSGLSLNAYGSIGTVEINGLDEAIDIECNSNFSLWCEVKPYIDSATWEINGKSAALCVLGNCLEYPPFPENHMFSMNTTTGDFILDVSPVTNATNGNTYKCDDGQSSLSVIPVIKAFPTSQTLKIDTSENTKITVSTGCVYPKKETDLDFEWFISKNNVNPSKEEALSAISNISTVNECTETNCAGLDTAYFNTTVKFEVYDEGESYYICVKVTHIDAKSRPAEICSDRQYPVLEKSTICVFGREDVIIIIMFILLFIAHIVCAIRDVQRIHKDKKCTWMEAILSTLPALFSLCIYIIVQFECKHPEKICIICKNIGIFGIIFGCLLGASYCIGITLYIWAYKKDKLQIQRRNVLFFFTFINLVILMCFAAKKQKISVQCTQCKSPERKVHSSFKREGKDDTKHNQPGAKSKASVPNTSCETLVHVAGFSGQWKDTMENIHEQPGLNILPSFQNISKRFPYI